MKLKSMVEKRSKSVIQGVKKETQKKVHRERMREKRRGDKKYGQNLVPLTVYMPASQKQKLVAEAEDLEIPVSQLACERLSDPQHRKRTMGKIHKKLLRENLKQFRFANRSLNDIAKHTNITHTISIFDLYKAKKDNASLHHQFEKFVTAWSDSQKSA